jgi:H/ACA ribonucleoprotein complex subunit 1
MKHTCEDDLVCKCTNEKVPYFNAPIFLENKQQIGKVDEIFGPVKDFVSFYINKNTIFKSVSSYMWRT